MVANCYPRRGFRSPDGSRNAGRRPVDLQMEAGGQVVAATRDQRAAAASRPCEKQDGEEWWITSDDSIDSEAVCLVTREFPRD